MPTGYTDDVMQGKITELKDYAMLCARAFGACIMMRDEPFDTPIPEEFEPSSYHKDRLKKSQEELESFTNKSPKELFQVFEEYKTSQKEFLLKEVEEKNNYKLRYEKMLEKARSYNPPSIDHYEFKEFMVNQLVDSINFDCDTSYYINAINALEALDFKQWALYKQEDLLNNIEHHTRLYKEEEERTNSRNEWISKLRESLNALS